MPTRSRLLVPIVLVTLSFTALAAAAPAPAAERRAPILERIHEFRAATWRWQRVMGVRVTPYGRRAERSSNPAFRLRIRHLWKQRATRAKRRAQNPPHKRAWLCIHRHEGPWNANTGNGYYGGLQMDMAFQRRYGARLLRRKGLAHRWTPLEQIWVAERARRSGRGFYPWPTAARRCGLI